MRVHKARLSGQLTSSRLLGNRNANRMKEEKNVRERYLHKYNKTILTESMEARPSFCAFFAEK